MGKLLPGAKTKSLRGIPKKQKNYEELKIVYLRRPSNHIRSLHTTFFTVVKIHKAIHNKPDRGIVNELSLWREEQTT